MSPVTRIIRRIQEAPSAGIILEKGLIMRDLVTARAGRVALAVPELSVEAGQIKGICCEGRWLFPLLCDIFEGKLSVPYGEVMLDGNNIIPCPADGSVQWLRWPPAVDLRLSPLKWARYRCCLAGGDFFTHPAETILLNLLPSALHKSCLRKCSPLQRMAVALAACAARVPGLLMVELPDPENAEEISRMLAPFFQILLQEKCACLLVYPQAAKPAIIREEFVVDDEWGDLRLKEKQNENSPALES